MHDASSPSPTPELQAQAEAYLARRRRLRKSFAKLYVFKAHNRQQQAQLRTAMLAAGVHTIEADGVQLRATPRSEGLNFWYRQPRGWVQGRGDSDD